MSPTHAMSVSRSTLLHASLAYISPEVQALDEIIYTVPTSASQRLPPTEILLLIRDHLFERITIQLIEQSKVALETYERSVAELLCSDCITYYLDIYGPDVWQWDHFSGACECVPPGDRDSRTTAYKSPKCHNLDHRSKLVQGRTSIPNPRQFVDRQHWLETHLSCQTATLPVKQILRHPRSNSSVARPATSSSSIDVWDVVNFVLHDFDCEVVRGPPDVLQAFQYVGRGQMSSNRDSVQIIPVQHHPDLDNTLLDNQVQLITRRAWHSLSLSLQYPDPFSTPKYLAPQSRRPNVSDPRNRSRYTSNAATGLLCALAGFMGICLSLPLVLATAFITVFCFYAKPRSLRIF